MRILLVHTGANEATQQWHESIAKMAPPPLQVKCFGLAVPGFKHRIDWSTLDLAWRYRHPSLMRAYEQLHAAAQEADALLLSGGYNLHPEFLDALPTFNAFYYYDDPESSDKSSRYVASAFDGVFYANVAARLQYEDWGCRKIAFLPNLQGPRDYPNDSERAKVLTGSRDNDIILCCGWNGGEWRRQRLRNITDAFPQARCCGKGWPGGFVPEQEFRALYGRSRIGWNIHNSSGPINRRLYSLAAWNILQICDNRTGLAEVFELGREAIGFDTIAEAIEATHYFLHHEEERRVIAQRGYERYWKQYHPSALWRRIEKQILIWREPKTLPPERAPLEIRATPTWQYQIHALPRSLHRNLLRWQISIRKRMADVTWPIDERFYLGAKVPYRTNTRFAKRRRACSRRDPGGHEHLEAEALAWAATAMIANAKSILIWGKSDEAKHFYRLARREPRRHIQNESQYSEGAVAGCDLLVAFNADVDEALGQMWPVTAETARPRRMILGFCSPQLAEKGGTNALFHQLRDMFVEVHFYWLPNPIVPWIEPLPGPLANISILIECKAHV